MTRPLAVNRGCDDVAGTSEAVTVSRAASAADAAGSASGCIGEDGSTMLAVAGAGPPSTGLTSERSGSSRHSHQASAIKTAAPSASDNFFMADQPGEAGLADDPYSTARSDR